MQSFEHSYIDRTFKITLIINDKDCFLEFEEYDKEKRYLNIKGLPVYKERIHELIDILTLPNTLHQIRSFYFGHDNKSILLFYPELLIGEIKNLKTGKRGEFRINDFSGKDLADYLEYVLEMDAKGILICNSYYLI